MAAGRRTKADAKRALMGLRAEDVDVGDRDPFGREAGAVLAVLMLAAYWPGKFADGWVTDDDIGACSRDLPQPKLKDEIRRDTIKTLVRRGLRELKRREPLLAVDRVPVGRVVRVRDPRERSTRLHRPPSLALEIWFTRYGLDRLAPDIRNVFREHSYGSLGTVTGCTSALEEALIYRVLGHPEPSISREALGIASQALARATTAHDVRVFTLALALAEVADDSTIQRNRGLARLQGLASESMEPRGGRETILQVRILTAIASELVSRERHGRTEQIGEAREYLDTARALVPPEDYVDLGEILFTEARIHYCEANAAQLADGDADDYLRHVTNAEVAMLAALNAWHMAQDWNRVQQAVRRIRGEVRSTLSRVDHERARILIPWLRAALRYEEFAVRATGDNESTNWLTTIHELKIDLLDAFLALPADTQPESLPIPVDECFALVQSSIKAFRTDSSLYAYAWGVEYWDKELPIERAPWYRAMVEKEKTRQGE